MLYRTDTHAAPTRVHRQFRRTVLSLATGGVHRYSLFYSVVCHFERCWLQLEELILWLTSGSWLLDHLLPPPDISSVSSAVSASGLLAGSLHFLFPLPDMLFLVSSHDCISYILRLLLKCSPEISSRNHPALGSSHPPYPALLFFIAMLSTWNIFTVCLPCCSVNFCLCSLRCKLPVIMQLLRVSIFQRCSFINVSFLLHHQITRLLLSIYTRLSIFLL